MSFTKFLKRNYPDRFKDKTEKVEEKVETNEEAAVEEVTPVIDDIAKMSKEELDKYAATLGIELDRRQSKSKMMNEFTKALENKKEK